MTVKKRKKEKKDMFIALKTCVRKKKHDKYLINPAKNESLVSIFVQSVRKTDFFLGSQGVKGMIVHSYPLVVASRWSRNFGGLKEMHKT